MAQSTNSSPARRLVFIAKTDADVAVPAAGNTNILDIEVSQLARVALEIRNTGANALDVFNVQGKVHPDGAYMTILTVAADYTTPAGIVVDASGDLTVLAAGATGWLILDALAFISIRLQASANVAGATTVGVFAGGS